MTFKYEQIDNLTQRAKVPGGWIVKTSEPISENVHNGVLLDTGYNWRVATCFVPDPDHEWEVE